ncbi:MAG: hypothetical protein C4527_23710 [Candidatus Omnitrophota bacterium]|nr:MAG: hypothetical protein C4527_23710 [Candidatus Omnitrophota bacterium]
MKTAEDAIIIINELPLDKIRKVADYVNSISPSDEEISLEEEMELNRMADECRQGINCSPPLEETDVIPYLRNLKNVHENHLS